MSIFLIEENNILLKEQLKEHNKTNEEKYDICLKIGRLCEKENNFDQGIYYLIESYKYDKIRLEGIYEVIKHYCCENNYEIAFSFYTMIEKTYNETLTSSLAPIHSFFLPYYMIIVCEGIKRYDVGIKMFEIIFRKKYLNADKRWIGCLFSNLNFFIDKIQDPIFFRLFEHYLNILYIHFDHCDFADNYLLLNYIHKYLNKDNILFFNAIKETVIKEIKKNFIKDKTIQSNKILFYTGFAYSQWNTTFGKKNFLGGSERAVAFLTELFPKNMEIYISGDVIEEKIDNVEYIHLHRLDEFLRNNEFHAIIISRYIGFFEMYHYFKAKQVFVWAHDISLIPYNNINKLTDLKLVLKYHENIDLCICLTNWHKELYEYKYPLLKDKIQIIANGIDFSLFPESNKQCKKVKNRFIYSSSPNRGLKYLLNLWDNITELLPDAELKIVGQESDDSEIIKFIHYFKNVEHLGEKNPTELYEIMATCDIWFYPVTGFNETYCITALEVLYSNIVCLYYPIAGLIDTVGEYGIAVNKDNELEILANLTEEKKDEMRIKGRKYVEECSWEYRIKTWIALLQLEE